MADSCPCGHPWDEHDRAQGCWRGWVTHSEGFLYGGCECANPAPDPGPHRDKYGAPCTCVPATEAVSGYTSHGHRIAGVVQTGRPASVARCGGPGLCTICSLEAGMTTNERHGR